MQGKIELPPRFLFMKVGNHAGEEWEQILTRKRKEYEDAGMVFWGYGGTACHPLRQVQPFARLSVREHGRVVLVMEPIDSKAAPDVVPATEYSRDGVKWEKIPKGISVTGSRYAFVLDEITPGELDLSLNEFEVAIGPSLGKPAESYIVGHTDKGCFVKSQNGRFVEASDSKKAVRKVRFAADLKDPFAVLLR